MVSGLEPVRPPSPFLDWGWRSPDARISNIRLPQLRRRRLGEGNPWLGLAPVIEKSTLALIRKQWGAPSLATDYG